MVVYADTTLAFPLLAAYAVSRAAERPRRELYARREALLADLKRAYQENAGRGEAQQAQAAEPEHIEIDRDR